MSTNVQATVGRGEGASASSSISVPRWSDSAAQTWSRRRWWWCWWYWWWCWRWKSAASHDGVCLDAAYASAVCLIPRSAAEAAAVVRRRRLLRLAVRYRLSCATAQVIQGGPKSKPLPIDKKSYYIVWKPVNEIRFICQIKVWIKHYNSIRWHYIFYVWPTFWSQ